MASLQLMHSAPSSASAADDMTALKVLDIGNTDLLLGGNSVLLDINKCPPSRLLFTPQRGTRRHCGQLGPYNWHVI